MDWISLFCVKHFAFVLYGKRRRSQGTLWCQHFYSASPVGYYLSQLFGGHIFSQVLSVRVKFPSNFLLVLTQITQNRLLNQLVRYRCAKLIYSFSTIFLTRLSVNQSPIAINIVGTNLHHLLKLKYYSYTYYVQSFRKQLHRFTKSLSNVSCKFSEISFLLECTKEDGKFFSQESTGSVVCKITARYLVKNALSEDIKQS